MAKKWQKSLFVFLSLIFVLVLAVEITPLNDLLTLPLIQKDPLEKRGVIIILGGGIKKDGRLAKQTAERTQEGLALSQEGYAGEILLAGGQAKNRSWPESDKMKEYALSLGNSGENIIKESASKNTYENAVNSLAIMSDHGFKDALVVTSPYHTRRACLIFKKLGTEITCQPVRNEFISPLNFWEKLHYFKGLIREYGAIVYFKIKGYI
ncbi:MAG: YdcF family protein [Patescibacteria group bacterium]